MSLPPALQNKNVQIGVIAVAILLALIFLFTQLMGSNSSPPPEAYLGTSGSMGPGGAMGPGGPGGPPGGAPGGPPGMMPGGSGYPAGTGYPGGSVAGGYGSDTAAGGPPLTAGGKAVTKKPGPRPPARVDPFKAPVDQTVEPPPISASLPADNNLYMDSRIREINTPTADQFVRDTPDPPMRMAGALFGNRVYGVLEINNTQQVVNPGDKIGIYRVERVERDKIVLSRPGRKGRRLVEAPLAGNPALANQFPTGDSSIPGGPSGYGGPPAGGGGSSGAAGSRGG